MRDIRFFSPILWQEEQDFWTSSLVMGIPSSSGFSSLAGVSAFFCSSPRTMRACRKRAIAAREMTNPALIVGPENRSQGLYHKDTKTQRCAKFEKVCKGFVGGSSCLRGETKCGMAQLVSVAKPEYPCAVRFRGPIA